MPFEGRADFLEERGDTYSGALNAVARLHGELERLREVDEAPGLRKRAADIQAEVEALEKRSRAENDRWGKERERLQAALRRARE